MNKIACAQCGEAFVAKNKQQLFCCRYCWDKHYRLNNRERCNKAARESVRRQRLRDPERIKNNNAKYRAKPKNRKHAANKSKEWHKNNREYANPRRFERKQLERNTYPWKGPLDAARSRAPYKKIPFDLTEEWARQRWTGFCELSGIPFRIGERGNGPRFFAPSLDQIKPKQGYTTNNSRFILWALNAFKYDGSDQDMFRVISNIRQKLSLDVAVFLSLPG